MIDSSSKLHIDRCPFCGECHNLAVFSNENMESFVCCMECKAKGPKTDPVNPVIQARIDAINLWNHRQ